MAYPVEVKYRKFPVQFGQRLTDIPSFVRWTEAGWQVTWKYRKVERGAFYVETLLKRDRHTELDLLHARETGLLASASIDQLNRR